MERAAPTNIFSVRDLRVVSVFSIIVMVEEEGNGGNGDGGRVLIVKHHSLITQKTIKRMFLILSQIWRRKWSIFNDHTISSFRMVSNMALIYMRDQFQGMFQGLWVMTVNICHLFILKSYITLIYIFLISLYRP